MKITLRCRAGMFAWVCGNGTQAMIPGEPVTVSTSPVKVAIMCIKDDIVKRYAVKLFDVVTTDAAVTNQTKFGNIVLDSVGGRLVDVTHLWVARAHKMVDSTNSEFSKFYKQLATRYQKRDNSDYGYMHRYMVEQDLPSGMPVPATCGQPLIEDGLREWSDAAVYSTFERCLHIAKLAVQFSEKAVVNVLKTQEALYVLALRMFGGVYHTKHETIDDRTLSAAKLYKNHDCDDMSLSSAAFAMRLSKMKSIGWPSKFSAGGILNKVSPAKAFILQGKTFTGGGHTWALLQKHDGTYLHLECTQMFAPHIGRLNDLYGPGVFLQRERNNMNTVIHGVKQLEPDMYARVCVLYSSDAMFIPCSGGYMCTDYETLLRGHCVLEKVPFTGHPPLSIRQLRATPSPAAVAKIIRRVHNAHFLVYRNSTPVTCTKAINGFDAVKTSTTKCVTISPGNVICIV